MNTAEQQIIVNEKRRLYIKEYNRTRRWKNREKVLEIERASQLKRRLANPVQNLIWAAKVRAKKFGLEFNITAEDLPLPTHCPLLGIPIVLAYKRRTPNSPSIDRIDPTKGYTKDNTWIISWRANDLKKDSTLQELELLYTNLKERFHG